MNRISVRGIGLTAAAMAATTLSVSGIVTAHAPAASAAGDSPSSAGVQTTDLSPDIRAEAASADLVQLHAARFATGVAGAAAARKAAAEHAAHLAHARQLAAKAAAARAAGRARVTRSTVRPVLPGTARALGRTMAAARGWTGNQFLCLDDLWTRESGWRVTAHNAGSGAYGIPQAQPGSKMASAGPDYRTNAATQIAWGLSYISGAYGSPCNAWSFWLGHHWY